MDYSNDYLLTSNDAAAAAIGLFVVGILLVSMIIGLTGYILNSAGLYTIAKRRGIRNPWLAWIPLVHVWIIGSISDHFRYVAKGQVKNKRKILVILMPLMAFFSLVLPLLTEIPGVGEAISDSILVMLIALVVYIGSAVTAAVTYYMAMYDLYTSVNPAYNVVFLVLSIIFNITEPFFVFFNRKKDLGMPPRGGAAPAAVQEPRVSNPEA